MRSDKPKIVLVGAGGHARSCIDVIEKLGAFNMLGLVGTLDELHSSVLGYKVIGTDDDLLSLFRRSNHAIITVGQIGKPLARQRIYELLCSIGFTLPVIISPLAYVSSHARLGPGTIVMHGAIVNAGAVVGANCIINSNALVEHDVTVGNHCHISTGAILNGHVQIGDGSFVGSGASIKQGIIVGDGCTIGMGLCLRFDLTPLSVYIGRK